MLLLGVGVVVAFLALALMSALDSPHRVSRVTIDNPHEWAATVEVAAVGEDDWLGLGTVGRQARQEFEGVLDQGRQWRFRFWYAGTQGGELTISRSELDDRGWTLTVPDSFPERMRAAGLAPTGG
ncbi:MAG: hypothetical protein M3N31_00210 [Actinomycetota bacterium]|nr:hypothetical protein [Actinomycetota bacterium]